MTYSIDGQPGDWVYVFIDMAPRAQILSYVEATFSMDAPDGAAAHGVYQKPFPIWSLDGTKQVHGHTGDTGRLQVVTLDFGGQERRSYPNDFYFITASRGAFVGFQAMAGADAPWHFDFTITLDEPTCDCEAVQPTQVVLGSGLSAVSEASSLPLLTGRFSVHEPVASPGWNLLDINSHALQPNGTRSVHGHDASGQAFDYDGWSAGTDLGPVSQSQTGFYWVGQVGTLADTPGNFEAELSWQELGTAPQVTFVHIPIQPEQFAPGAVLDSYWTPDWPFEEA